MTLNQQFEHWINLKKNTIFSSIKIDIRFGLLASHLLTVIFDRINTRHAQLNIPYSIEGYNLFRIYDNVLRESESEGIALGQK